MVSDMAQQNLKGQIVNGHLVSGAIYGQNPSGTISTGSVRSHTVLTNRDAEDQHPISAITDLQETLDAKANSTDLAQVAFSGLFEDLTSETFTVINCGSSTEVI